MTPLDFEEIQAVAGGVTAGPDGKGCTEGWRPTDFGKNQQQEQVQ